MDVGEHAAGLFFSDVEVDGRSTSVRVANGIVVAVGEHLEACGDDQRIDGEGGALIPGLWDHHVHLAAVAARAHSIDLSGRGLAEALDQTGRAPRRPTGIRAVGYDETEHGHLDRDRLDELLGDVAARVQHHSGALWIWNSAALRDAGIDPASSDGRIFREPDRMHSHTSAADAPDVVAVARRFASRGITGITDATPVSEPARLELLTRATPWLRVVAMTGPEYPEMAPPRGIEFGPVKIVISDHAYPDFEETVAWIERAHRAGRNVAFHAVTRTAVAFAIAGLDAAGVPAPSGHPDRIEHGSIIEPAMIDELVRRNGTVVTQPGFIAAHGDRYRQACEPDELAHLYRCASLIEAGVGVAAGSDAPHGPENPWEIVVAAQQRRTRTGVVLGRGERLDAMRALNLWLGDPTNPGGPPRKVAPHHQADLCLLDVPLDVALRAPKRASVCATYVAGRRINERSTS